MGRGERKGRPILGAVSLLAAALLAIVFAAGVASSGPHATAAVTLDAEEDAFLSAINNHRAQNGLGPLAISPELEDAARWMSGDMASKNYFSHTDSLGRDPFTRIADFGYTYNTWKGENLAAGVATGQGAFDLWKNSPGHNANMLGANYTVIGVARAYGAASTYGWYWTTDFGGQQDPLPPPDPTPTPSPTSTATPTLVPTPTPTPVPTPTPTPVPTPDPTPTPTPTPSPTPSPAATPEPTPLPTHTPPPPTPTPQPELPGDVDCSDGVDSVDALLILRIAAAMLTAGCGGGTDAADVNCDGKVDSLDALAILHYLARLSDSLPGGCSG